MDSLTIRAMADAVPLPMIVIGQDERILAANPAATTLFGAGIEGRHHLLTLRQPALQSAIAAALTEGRGGQARHVIPGPSQDVAYRVTVSPVAGPGAAALTFEDVTEAEQMGQMRRDFVANVSHELRTPLTALLGFIETLRGAARDDAAARDRFLAIMEREAERMNRLIRDLLHLSRVESEERVRPTDRVDIAALLASALALLRPLAEAQNVTLTTTGLDGPLPVPGDADQITQVLTNLIENAVKYGGAGGKVTIRLSREALPRGPGLRIDVIDTGEGIESQHLPRLTERFYRVDGHRSREKGGTGLGLAIVKHIVNRHRGRMRIESEKGKGSVFTVVLPEA
ncbi:ATP-binding protein [Paragemmobacter straminiformis]|uniref:histidine kinase n=1 Tax=Paragemmobacter straminiformis TaxID=2045119 RepID=A0A842I6A8_9RHOB|nr:ATP-binding protein [Gemmobacter straminiformis]MBC2835380.1 PAS domain-containing protein [Gemmobacter straminiformis]